MEEITNTLLKKIATKAGLASENEPPKFQFGAVNYVQKIISGRATAEKTVVKQILDEIITRDSISKDIQARIDLDIIQCANFLHEIHSITERQYLIDNDGLRFSGRRTTIDMKMLELEGEKRAEEVNAWKDMSALRRYLLFALKDYWNAVRRAELINLQKCD